MPSTKAFHLLRKEDATGISGTGIVAVGVQLPTGRAVLEWLGSINSITIHQDMEQLAAVHCHGGLTEVIWEDA